MDGVDVTESGVDTNQKEGGVDTNKKDGGVDINDKEGGVDTNQKDSGVDINDKEGSARRVVLTLMTKRVGLTLMIQKVKMMILMIEVFFYDTDYDLSDDDDILYEKYIDSEIEFTVGKKKMKEVGSNGKEKMPDSWSKRKEKMPDSGSKRKEKIPEGGSKGKEKMPDQQEWSACFEGETSFNEDDGYTSSDSLQSLCSSDGEEHMQFCGKEISILSKNDFQRVRAKCKGNNYPWVVLASRMVHSETFQIRTLNTKHKCGRTLIRNKKVHNDLNCDISRSQYYRTKKKINDMLNGDFRDQYTRLWDYTEEIKRSNPNSTVVLKTYVDEVSGEEKFQRLYNYFDACRQGFLQDCRPLIGVNGCHLRGSHKGILLTAVGIDPNNCIFPICYCVTEGEDFNRWKWFLELLIGDLGMYDQQKWTFVLDRQTGLLPALYELLLDIEHRYCVRHMNNNFKKDHPGKSIKDRMWNIAKASTINQFNFFMVKVKEIDEGAHMWMANVFPRRWSRSHFRTSPKCGILLNNMCESFNSAILEAKSKPLLAMMESLRIYLMKKMQSKRNAMSRWNVQICPKILAKMDKLKDNTRTCISTFAGAGKFEVKDMWNGQYVVDLVNHSCSCT
ncbi:hypothetical protein BUALT_Bualt18G0065900 [Buddleja alternifolia]|uniref:MULE transposase domain-containing protein n=1 Tax=Buddleja alternifolia TaxID=168488 RepID=A0AAV6WDG7_9LAMI|nr:hypothetical protein BUALT_Bualt18G0065900 [Buddleja alternifolia]